MNTEVEQYIRQQQAKVKVEPYDNIVFNKAFKGRTRGMWAGATMGAISGLILGTLAWPLVTTMAGATIGFGTMVMAATAIGSATGVFAGQVIGATAGATAGAALEREKRDRQEALREKLLSDPDIEKTAHEAAKNPEPVNIKDLPSPNTLEEVAERPTSLAERFGQVVNFKVVAASMALGGVLGAAIGGLGGKWGGLLDLGIEGVGGNMLAGALLVGTVSSIFGIGYPIIFASLSELNGKILSGKIFEREPEKTPEKATEKAHSHELAPAKAPEAAQPEPAAAKDNAAASEKRFASKSFVSFSHMVVEQQANAQETPARLH